MFDALIVKSWLPTAVDAAIVIRPLVPFMLTPVGCPVRLNVIVAVPVAVTWNVPPIPFTTVVLFTDVILGATGASFTLKVKFCVASGLTMFDALIVKS
jgi:hypothetical protein